MVTNIPVGEEVTVIYKSKRYDDFRGVVHDVNEAFIHMKVKCVEGRPQKVTWNHSVIPWSAIKTVQWGSEEQPKNKKAT